MPDTKISALAALGAAPAAGDLLALVDISDTSMAGSGTDKKITWANLVSGMAGTGLSVASGVLSLATGAAAANLGYTPVNRAGDSGLGTMTMAEAANLAVGTTTGTKIGTATTQKLGFWNATPVVRPAAYTTTNVATDRSYDANVTSLDEIADVLGTLIADLKSIGLIG